MKQLSTTAEVAAAERVLKLSWVIVAGAVLFSVLTVTPLVERVTPDRWDWTAPILPIVVDAAVVIVVRIDAIVARLGGRPGGWSAALRWLTGALTLALNVGDSALSGDMVGVGVHIVAPVLLITTAEATLTYRRTITAAVARIEHERAEEVAAERREHQAEQERSRAERDAARQAEERQREQERADRMRDQERADERDRAEREHAAQLAREEREHAAQVEADRANRAAALAAAEREETARQKREEDDRADRLAREARDRAESEKRAKEAQQRALTVAQAPARPNVAAAAVSTPRPAVSAAVSTPAHKTDTKPPKKKMSETDARAAVAEAVRAGTSQRQTAALTGWSTGWIAARYKDLEQVPGQTEITVQGAAA